MLLHCQVSDSFLTFREKCMDSIKSIIKDLYRCKPHLTRRKDFDTFRIKTIIITKKNTINPEKVTCRFPSSIVKGYDISYYGFGETRIHGWYIVPAFIKQKKLPCLIHYHGQYEISVVYCHGVNLFIDTAAGRFCGSNPSSKAPV